jgi:hypothetical protein
MDVFALSEPIHVVITVYQRYAATNSLANAIFGEDMMNNKKQTHRLLHNCEVDGANVDVVVN